MAVSAVPSNMQAQRRYTCEAHVDHGTCFSAGAGWSAEHYFDQICMTEWEQVHTYM
jgi:hypothetical protein